MTQQTADTTAQQTAHQLAGEALSQALSAMAEASRYGRGTRIVAVQLGHRLGASGAWAGHRVASAGHRLGSAYGALRGPEPHSWRTREVTTLVVVAMLAGAGLSYAYRRRARLLREIAADTED